ncbi:MAG: tRNA (adenosine(37)-N6)-threonylcarbamoyltransferase complex ATPase subunit type 1 TsaE [Planctomycetes bacterium]|nr:tRNA (adenosine(37)-N6)-threonylcarbamoyltransferase complex ATPase subunit type 1 TsaE [Planctomycetota bacterium]
MEHHVFEIKVNSPEETRDFGRLLGENCTGGEIFLLSGDLGAGKTCLTQGLARGLGVPEDEAVTSPTFVLHCQYYGRFELNHIDLYRLGTEIDWEHLGFEEFMGRGDSVTSVEWAEFMGEEMPHEHIGVHINSLGETERLIRLTPVGKMHSDFVDKISGKISS